MSSSPESKQGRQRKLPEGTRKFLLSSVASLAILAGGDQPAQAQTKYEPRPSAELATGGKKYEKPVSGEKQVQRGVSVIARNILNEYHDIREQGNDKGQSAYLNKVHGPGNRYHIAISKGVTSLSGDGGVYHVSTVMKKVDGKLSPATASEVHMNANIWQNTNPAPGQSASLESVQTFSAEKQGKDWTVDATYVSQKGETMQYGTNTVGNAFDAELGAALIKDGIGLAAAADKGMPIGGVLPGPAVIEATHDPNNMK